MDKWGRFKWIRLAYLKIKKYLVFYFWFIFRRIINTYQIVGLPTRGVQHTLSLRWRYLIVKCVDHMINGLDSIRWLFTILRNSVDVEMQKIQIIKDLDSGLKTIIIDANQMNQPYVTLKNAIDTVNGIVVQETETMMRQVVLRFDIHHNDHGTICMKDYLIKYRDEDKVYHHTLENIAVFNNLELHPESEVRIRFIKNGKIVNATYSYADIDNVHIQHLFVPLNDSTDSRLSTNND